MAVCRVDIKPLSVNQAWQGRRFRTKKYKAYQEELKLKLPPNIDIPDGDLKVYYEFGLSSKLSDWDNSIKNFQDSLCAKYGFDDRRIMEGHVKKVIVKKGEEYIKFAIESI